jgi:hypothetical protein
VINDPKLRNDPVAKKATVASFLDHMVEADLYCVFNMRAIIFRRWQTGNEATCAHVITGIYSLGYARGISCAKFVLQDGSGRA